MGIALYLNTLQNTNNFTIWICQVMKKMSTRSKMISTCILKIKSCLGLSDAWNNHCVLVDTKESSSVYIFLPMGHFFYWLEIENSPACRVKCEETSRSLHFFFTFTFVSFHFYLFHLIGSFSCFLFIKIYNYLFIYYSFTIRICNTLYIECTPF